MKKKRKIILSPLKQADFPLTILEDLGMILPSNKSKRRHRMLIVECPICSDPYRAMASYVKSGKSYRCMSCYNKNRTKKHGKTDTRLYKIWMNMKNRCNNPNTKDFKNYGERGIKICVEWEADFLVFYNWAIGNGYKEYLKIDRINNDVGYEPYNCRWATQEVQSRNTRRLYSGNTSGYRGVSFNKKCSKFVAYISVGDRKRHLGYFLNKTDAAKAYDDYVTEHNLEHTKNFN